jgi:RNA polymerase sigma-70 factor (ECF subfamily)
MRMPAADEQQLILQAKEGSHEAFRLLVERHMKQAYDVAYRFLNNHDHAEDVAQEAFVRVYRSMQTFRGDAQFGTWLYRIIMNLSLNRLKQKKTEDGAARDLARETESVAGNVPDRMDVPLHIERALHELPTLQRAVVILRHIDGLSTKQVSSILRCSEGTVKTHLYRGLKKLKKKLQFLKEEMP